MDRKALFQSTRQIFAAPSVDYNLTFTSCLDYVCFVIHVRLQCVVTVSIRSHSAYSAIAMYKGKTQISESYPAIK